MNEPIWQTKKLMCEIGNRIWIKGFCAGNEGNHSVRVSDDRVVCTPTGISKGMLNPEDICVCDMDGTLVETNRAGRRPSSEVKVHNAIYQHRRDVNAVIHSHPPHATAFAIANIPLPSGIHPEAEVFLGNVPLAHYATPSTHDLPDSIIPLIGPETNSVLMGNHGSVSFATNGLMDAYYKLEILEAYCRILLLCKQVGKINTLTNNEMTDLLKVKQNFGMSDARIDCAPDGCVVEGNQPFFSTFDDQTASASCNCDGDVRKPATDADSPEFERMVQMITDQIMQSVN